MKNKISVFLFVLSTFFVFLLSSGEVVKAGNCDDSVAGLRVSCNATSSVTGVDSAIVDTIKQYEKIDINRYNFNNVPSHLTADANGDRYYYTPAMGEEAKKAARTVVELEPNIAVLGGELGSGNTLQEQIYNAIDRFDVQSGAGYIASSPYYGVQYLYTDGYDYSHLYPYGGYIDLTMIRGANAIIFQDKYSPLAYNKGYYYQYCESRFIWCWKWSGYIEKQIYTRTNSKGTYNASTGKLTYKDLSSVQMIMPGFHIKEEFYGSGCETLNGNRYCDLNRFAFDGPYDSDNTLMRDVYGWDNGFWYERFHQPFFTYLVMKYSATISFYYKDDSKSTSTVVVLRKATLPVNVYVTYKAEAGNYTGKFLVALNGYNNTNKREMSSSGISSQVSLIPVQYDLSMILNPSYWNGSKIQDTGEVVSVIAGKVSSYQIKKVGGKTIYLNTVGITDDGIDIVATGVYTERGFSTVTLFTSGKIYYEYEEMDFIDFSFRYQIGSGEVVDLTPYLTSYLSNAGVCEKCSAPINGTPLKANLLNVWVDAQGDPVELKVYSSTSASEIKLYPNSNRYLSVSYVTQSKAEYTTSLSTSRLIIFQVVYFGASYYIPFTFDNVAPQITSFAEENINGRYIVVESEEELNSLNFTGSDDISNTVSQVEVESYLSNEGNAYKYTLTITDEAGNKTSAVYDVIIDNQNPTSIEGTAVLPNGREPLSSHGDSFTEFQVDANLRLGRTPSAETNFLDSFFDVNLNSISTSYDLSALVPFNAVLVDEGDSFSLDVVIKDYGVYGYTSAGIKGLYIKTWLNTDDETAVNWQYLSNGNYNTIETSFNIALTSGTNYIALASIDYMNHLYKQDGSGNNYKFYIKVYAINVYGTPYISEIVATEDGFGAVVRDDLTMFKDTGVSTSITEYVIVDSTESDKSFETYATSTLAVKTILNNASSSMILATPVSPRLTSTVTKNKAYGGLSEYITDFESGPGWTKYSNLTLSSRLVAALRVKDLNLNNMDNQMLIRGLLLNGQAYIYAHVVINTSPSPIDMYQRIIFANSYVKSNSPTLELTNEYTDENTGNIDNVFSISGDDEVSYWDGTDMMIRYKLNMYKQSNPAARTGDIGEDIYSPNNFIIYYKSCYQSEGTFGAATVCAGSAIRYYSNDDLNLGKVNSNYLYKVYVGVVVALEYDIANNRLIEKYNNDPGYSVVDFASSKFMVNNDTAMNQYQLVETYYETYYGMFLYDTSIPEVIVEYTTINEYNPDGINKLKDVNYAAELGEMENFIIKVTVKYESDKFRKPAYWTRLDKDSIYWFPYHYATGNSVCGNVDRIECGYDKAFTTFGLEEALSNTRATYDPDVGLVYYLQYPTTDDIAKVSASYSADVFDLIVKLTTTNGLRNDGMDLMVGDVIRKENQEFLTIYYDQDGPKILITSSPDKDAEYYAVSISAEDVSSNVAKVSFYYGKYDVENPDPEAFLLYEEIVNAKTFSGYSAKLTQKGWYTVVAEDEFGQLSTYSFEVVQVGEGVMYSPTLDDTDQIEDKNDETAKVVVTLMASMVSLLVAGLIIALIIGIGIIYLKYGKALKMGKKVIKKAKPIAKYTKNAGGWVGAASKVVDSIPDEAVEEKPKEEPQPEEQPEQPEENDDSGHEE